jgi:pyrimidine-nucleoside phosphorylase
MNTVEIIRKKRDGAPLAPEELTFFMDQYMSGNLPDYQMSAFLMACYFRGMAPEEARTFTDLMLHSGTVLDLSDIQGSKVDKHSTGGVADTVSLLLAPIVASCGASVPMISGRGLGHTGGTLDKLESIPGFRTDLSVPAFKRVLADIGVSMIGQTADVAPADKKLYALRDVTATIECIPLIAGSIMSKKIASGIDALVLDIKTGDGAFMKEYDQAVELGRTLVDIGNAAGKRTIAYVTDMSQPLGSRIGNWLEVEETIRCLEGKQDALNKDLLTITHLLAGTLLFLSGKAEDIPAGIDRSRLSIDDGSALRKLMDLVKAQGGDIRSLESPDVHPPAQYSLQISAERDGFLTQVETHSLGMCAVLLGAGRLKIDDNPDPVAGVITTKRIGMEVSSGDVLATAYSNDEASLASVSRRLHDAFVIGTTSPVAPPLVRATITKVGVQEWTSMDDPVYPDASS